MTNEILNENTVSKELKAHLEEQISILKIQAVKSKRVEVTNFLLQYYQEILKEVQYW